MVWYFFCTVPPPPKLGFAASPLWPPPPLPLDFNMANSPMQPLHCAHQCVFRRSGFHNSLWETTRPFQCRTASRFCSLPTVVQINKHITSQSATGTTAQALLENAGGAPDAVRARGVRDAAIRRNPWERWWVVVWICPLVAHASADVLVWDHEGPQRAKGHFKDTQHTKFCMLATTRPSVLARLHNFVVP